MFPYRQPIEDVIGQVQPQAAVVGEGYQAGHPRHQLAAMRGVAVVDAQVGLGFLDPCLGNERNVTSDVVNDERRGTCLRCKWALRLPKDRLVTR